MNMRIAAALIVVWLMLASLGCESPEQAEILACYAEFSEACDASDAERAVHRLSAETKDFFTSMLATANTGTREQVRGLPFVTCYSVLFARHVVPLQERKLLDGEAYLRRVIAQGHWAEPGETSTLTKIKVRGGTATGMLKETGDNAAKKVDFRLEGGVWKIDFVQYLHAWSRDYEQYASDHGMDVHSYFMIYLEEETGRTPRGDIYDKP